jgi:hypothetical protein
LLAAAACVALLGAAYLHAAGDDVERIRGSVYPGQRVSLGGERSLADLFNANLGAPFWLGIHEWLPLRNVCEAASFLFFGPLLVAFDAARRIARGRRIDPLSAVVALYAALLGWFVLVGLPESVARASLLASVPGPRAVLGLGIADAVLLVRFLANEEQGAKARGLAALLAGAFGLALAACVPPLLRALPALPAAPLFAAAALQAALGYALLAGPRRVLALALAVAWSAASSLWFNPLAAGGSATLTESALARAALAIDRDEGGATTWLVFGRAELADLLRSVGLHTLNGTLPVPQPALWRGLDPDGRNADAYNRYGSAILVAARLRTPRIRARQPTVFSVAIDPASPALRSLGATHVLADARSAAAFGPQSGFEELGRAGSARLFRVNPVPSRPGAAPPASASPGGTR